MISIIIPSYNHSAYIGRCIESVISQSHEDWELIVIDDGSKDHSNDIIASYVDSRITHLRQENRGAHNTINRGLDLAKGTYLTILNSDDEYHPRRLEKCMAAMGANPGVGMVTTWINVVDSRGAPLGTKRAWENMEPWPIANRALSFAGSDDYAKNALMANFVATTSNMFFRRRLYEDVGGMRNLRFAHDWDFLLRACTSYKCLSLPEALLSYRIHQTNTISSNRKAMLFEVCWIIAANIDRYEKILIPEIDGPFLKSSALGLLESINFQGNDQIFWVMYWHIRNLKDRGIENPEQLFLDDEDFRLSLISYIKE